MAQWFSFPFYSFPCSGFSHHDASSISLQDHEKLSQGGVAESTPLSPPRSYKGTSTNSSHLHLGTVEMLSLRRSDPLPQKLLAHLAEGGGADLCSLSPYRLRLSGAGFAYCAPGPETSVWTQARTLTLRVHESGGPKLKVHLTMCNQDLKGWGFLEQNTNQHVHTHQPLCWVHHVHFLGYTWVDDPLEIVALTHHLHTFCFRVVPVLVSSKFPPSFHLNKSKKERGTTCGRASFHALMNCAVSTCWTFLHSSSSFPVSRSCLFLHFHVLFAPL